MVTLTTATTTSGAGFNINKYQARGMFDYAFDNLALNRIRLFDDVSNDIVFFGTGFTGDLTTGLTGGTIGRIYIHVNGALEFDITGLSISAVQFYNLARANNTPGLWDLVLQGNDIVVGTGSGDILFAGRGNDTLRGYIGPDSLYGNAGNDTIFGGAGADFLSGGPGSDLMIGGNGLDALMGGFGPDAFYFANSTSGRDTIADFTEMDQLELRGAVFHMGSYSGLLPAANFVSHTTNKAIDANDYFIFRTTDDTLWYDSDGKGTIAAPVLIADLLTDFNLKASDIHIGNLLL